MTNCKNKADVISETSSAGGIAGNAGAFFYNCSNEGNVQAINEDAGGILGNDTAGGPSGKFINCYNTATVEGKKAGGIIGERLNGSTIFMNLYNTGDIIGNQYSGGCIGDWRSDGVVTIYNFYNAGKVSNALIGSLGSRQPKVENVYCLENNSKKIIGKYYFYNITDEQKQYMSNLENSFYTQEYMQNKEFVGELNNNKTIHSDISQEWNIWKENKINYPIF